MALAVLPYPDGFVVPVKRVTRLVRFRTLSADQIPPLPPDDLLQWRD